MNDPTYVEASRKLAERMMTEAARSDEAKIAFVFRLADGPRPDAGRKSAVLEEHATIAAACRLSGQTRPAAEKLLRSANRRVNEEARSRRTGRLDDVASVILNLDEAITKG